MADNKSVESYISKKSRWQKELNLLRELLSSTEMEETVKWGAPCYTVDGKNVVGLAAFKQFVSLWFHQGVFLEDKRKVLINASEGTTRGLRQWRFSSIDDIDKKLVSSYVAEAIENQKKGLQVKPAERKAVVIPPELAAAMKKESQLKKSFERFTPGKQREFADFISGAKRTDTKEKRLAKIVPMILRGEGLSDRYRK